MVNKIDEEELEVSIVPRVEEEPTYTLIKYKGVENARQYPNGTIRHPRGYILYLPPELAKERKALQAYKAKLSAEEALRIKTKSETPEEGWGKVLMKRIEVALKDNGRAGNDAARLVGLATGFLTNDKQVEVAGQIQHKPVMPQLPQEYLDMVKKIMAKPQPETIEGRVINDDTEDDTDDE